MDLTFGGGEFNPQIFGGILIRALMDLKTSEYIEGPCNSISRLLRIYDAEEFKDLTIPTYTSKHDGDAFSRKSLFRLEFTQNLQKREPVSCPRVGLTLKRPDTFKEKYWMANYRYLSFPEKCKKQKILIEIALILKGLEFEKIGELLEMKSTNSLSVIKRNIEKGIKLTVSRPGITMKQAAEQELENAQPSEA